MGGKLTRIERRRSERAVGGQNRGQRGKGEGERTCVVSNREFRESGEEIYQKGEWGRLGIDERKRSESEERSVEGERKVGQRSSRERDVRERGDRCQERRGDAR